MSRYARKRDPAVPKVESVELSGKHSKLRLVLTIVFLALAVFFIGYGLISALNRDPGWQEVSVSSGAALNCGQDLTFRYHFTGGAAESKQLTALYTQAAERAYALFQPAQEMIGYRNLYTVNASPNTPVEVEPELYAAFALLAEADSRALYLAPVYAEYMQMFRSGDDYEASQFDPFTSAEEQDYFAGLLPFVQDDAHIDLELLGENTVCLHVSDEYLRFAEEYGIEAFLDFSWMKNAFIVDFISAQLAENGFTHGYLSSFDGFFRNLDKLGEIGTVGIYDRMDGEVLLAAEMSYQKAISAVCLRDFPVQDTYTDYYYVYASGDTRTPYVGLSDGLCRASASTLLAWSEDTSCAQMLLRVMPLYIAETLDRQALDALSDEGIYSLSVCGTQIRYNDPDVRLSALYHSENRAYDAKYSGK